MPAGRQASGLGRPPGIIPARDPEQGVAGRPAGRATATHAPNCPTRAAQLMARVGPTLDPSRDLEG
eukprot:3272591-Lingulodinium_polyedra.AAC.1